MADPEYADELWLAIPFAPDYAVSSLGRVKRTAADPAHRRDKILKGKISPTGYPEVTLYVNGAPFFFTVHRLVCRVFHGDRPRGKDEVGHRDGNRANARVDNLRWVTKEENYADRNAHGTHNRGENNGAAKLDTLKVQAIHILAERLASRKIAAVFGISKSQVGNILRGDGWASGARRRGRRAEAKALAGESEPRAQG